MKKLLCIILAIAMVASTFAIVASAYSWNDPDCLTVEEGIDMWMFDNDEEMPETFRYYFLMPDGTNGERGDNPELESNGNFAPTWYKLTTTGELATSTAGIYWWDSGVADPAAWIGYIASGSDEDDPNIYYANVPVDVTTIVWNNAVDGGLDETDPIYKCAAQSVNIGSEYYDVGESPNYPDGTESFNNMIFVIDPDLVMKSDASEQMTCGGEWYYYYGKGCYGFTADGSEADCLRDDHYDESGNHVIPDVQKPTAPEFIETQPEATEPEATEPEATEPEATQPEATEPETKPVAPTQPPQPTQPEVKYEIGDVDGDGRVDIVDVSEIQLHLAGVKTLSSSSLAAADANGDGDVNIIDATHIQRFLAKLIKKL
ncbi:MAG: hypothetical protein IJ433_02230 [Ruminococcus sp.]|nr:hypothetical protein [Ruminococcus sp.]